MVYPSVSRRIFIVCNYIFLITVSLLCVLPLLHVLSISLRSSGAVSAGSVLFSPVDFTLESYKIVLSQGQFFQAFLNSVTRLLLGTSISLSLCLLTAYPLSKESGRFKLRTPIVWYFVFTMLFGGGLIPWYLVVKQTQLLNTIWALVIPGALNVFNVILMLNFFRGLPKELEESAMIDGAGHLRVLARIFLPISLPSIATIALFTMVNHWNSWFDGLILMKNPDNYPLATYLQAITIDAKMLIQMNLTNPNAAAYVSDRTGRAAQIFMTALPILLIYPFLQKYFVSGLTLGSVKE